MVEANKLTLTAEQAFKSKLNFDDYWQKHNNEITDELLKDYDDKHLAVIMVNLTQNIDTLIDAICEIGYLNPYYVWIVANEKENLVKYVEIMNEHFIKGVGIFLVKAYLKGDKMKFKTLVKPNLKTKNSKWSKIKQLQLNYWTKYFEICDSLNCDLQVRPAPHHWQYLPIGKTGVSIQLTINTQENYVGCELLINNSKDIFYSLYESKAEIEKELGEIDWHELKGKKSSKIRKIYLVDINDESNWEMAIKEQIRMSELFKKIFSAYL